MNKITKIIALICLNIISLFYLSVVLANETQSSDDYYIYSLSVNNNSPVTIKVNKNEPTFYYENISIDKQCEQKHINDVANFNIGFKKATRVLLNPVKEESGRVKMIVGVSLSYPEQAMGRVKLDANCSLVNAYNDLKPFITVDEFVVNKPVNISIQDGLVLKLNIEK